jgi:hypothetical protein
MLSLRNPAGPISTSPQVFHGWTWRLPSFRVLLTWSLEVVLFWRSLSSDMWFFKEKLHSLSVAPEPLAYLKQKVRGSWTLVEKTKSLFSRYVPCSPRAYIRVLFGYWELGWRVFYWCWWWLVVELNSLWSWGYSASIFFRICLSSSTISSRACPLVIAFCLFTDTFVRLVLLVLPVHVHCCFAYKYLPSVLLLFIRCLVV